MTILLFNWFGYGLLSSFLEARANIRLEEQLDNDLYNASELISIKIPAAGYLPYANSIRDFKRMNGQIEMEDLQYNYVKWRLYDDTLEFLCLPNVASTNIQHAKINFFKLVNDLQSSDQNKKPNPSSNTSKNFSPEFYLVTEFSGFPDLYFRISKKISYPSLLISVDFSSPVEYPPEHHC